MWLIRATSQENRELYRALANASLASRAWSIFSAVKTLSFLASCERVNSQLFSNETERPASFTTYCRFRRERSDDPIGIHLKEMSSPANFGVGADLHALLAVSHLLPVKVHVAEVQHAGENLEDRVLLLGRESQHLHGGKEGFEVLCVALPIDLAIPTLTNFNCDLVRIADDVESCRRLPDSDKSICPASAIRTCPWVVGRDQPTARRTRDSSFPLALAWLSYSFPAGTALSFPLLSLRWK